ncbi:MAG: 6-bladed beta-propeller [Bacteroidales bacterium]|nr:6-bladed beta-propeller [Bacteroidales bacterium]
MKNLFFLLPLLLMVQCHTDKTNKQDQAIDQDKFFVINYEKALQNKKTINLSDIASEVKYIPLQTDTQCLLGRGAEYHFTDQYIFIGNKDHVLVFDYAGKFIRKIGNHGKGPQEIDIITLISLDDINKTIAIQTLMSRKLLFFSYDGTFLESFQLKSDGYHYVIEKDKFLSYELCAGGREDFVFRLTNRNNDTISTVRNHFKWENKTGYYMMLLGDISAFYEYNAQLYFKGMYNDTVYTISKNEIKPAYYIDLGKYRLPDDARFENPASTEKFQKVKGDYFLANSTEARDQIFVTTVDFNDSIRRNIIHHLNSPEDIFLVKEYGEPSGCTNDWDGGPEFWPAGNVNDNTVYMPLSPLTLKDLTEEEGFKNNKALYPEKKKDFVEMVERLKEEDNAVILVVTLK